MHGNVSFTPFITHHHKSQVNFQIPLAEQPEAKRAAPTSQAEEARPQQRPAEHHLLSQRTKQKVTADSKAAEPSKGQAAKCLESYQNSPLKGTRALWRGGLFPLCPLPPLKKLLSALFAP